MQEKLKESSFPCKEAPSSTDCEQAWNKFYTANKDNFFKKRNYLTFAFDTIQKEVQTTK